VLKYIIQRTPVNIQEDILMERINKYRVKCKLKIISEEKMHASYINRKYVPGRKKLKEVKEKEMKWSRK
jgi:hypothetical protein